MTASDLVRDLKQAADDIHDMRLSSDDVARLLRAAAIEIGLWQDRCEAMEATRRTLLRAESEDIQ
jgi:hypothetical protein